MSNEEILQKAIRKAIGNGYDIGDHSVTTHIIGNDIYTIIFSHDFAKAFWGEKKKETNYFGEQDLPGVNLTTQWQPLYIYHLMQMVRWENPLEYLQKFL